MRRSALSCWSGEGEFAVEGDSAAKVDMLTLKRFPVLGAYELALKCSHVFNLLDARGAISVTERVGVMARIRALVIGVATAYVAQSAAVGASRTVGDNQAS